MKYPLLLSVHVKRTVGEEFKMYKNGELVVYGPVKREAFDALIKCENDKEALIKCESDKE